jgi:hypothetical protein
MFMTLEESNIKKNSDIVSWIKSRLENINNSKVIERFWNPLYLDEICIDYNLEIYLKLLKKLFKSFLENPDNQKRQEMYSWWTDEDIMTAYYCLFWENLTISSLKTEIKDDANNIIYN